MRPFWIIWSDRHINEAALDIVFVRLLMNEVTLVEQLKLSLIHYFAEPTSTAPLPPSMLIISLQTQRVLLSFSSLAVWSTQEQRRMGKSNWTRNEIVQEKISFLSTTGFLLFLSSSSIMDSCGRNVAKMSLFLLKKGGACNQGSERKNHNFFKPRQTASEERRVWDDVAKKSFLSLRHLGGNKKVFWEVKVAERTVTWERRKENMKNRKINQRWRFLMEREVRAHFNLFLIKHCEICCFSCSFHYFSEVYFDVTRSNGWTINFSCASAAYRSTDRWI